MAKKQPVGYRITPDLKKRVVAAKKAGIAKDQTAVIEWALGLVLNGPIEPETWKRLEALGVLWRGEGLDELVNEAINSHLK